MGRCQPRQYGRHPGVHHADLATHLAGFVQGLNRLGQFVLPNQTHRFRQKNLGGGLHIVPFFVHLPPNNVRRQLPARGPRPNVETESRDLIVPHLAGRFVQQFGFGDRAWQVALPVDRVGALPPGHVSFPEIARPFEKSDRFPALADALVKLRPDKEHDSPVMQRLSLSADIAQVLAYGE